MGADGNFMMLIKTENKLVSCDMKEKEVSSFYFFFLLGGRGSTN